jgi:hypothetical protein
MHDRSARQSPERISDEDPHVPEHAADGSGTVTPEARVPGPHLSDIRRADQEILKIHHAAPLPAP